MCTFRHTIAPDVQLRGFEFVKAVHLIAEAFTLESGLLTPTFKVRAETSSLVTRCIAVMMLYTVLESV